MRLENVIALTYGKLVNSPFVSNFTNVVFKAKDVKRGDLFVAFDVNEIDEAIFHGAYGILFSKPTQISDSEIAWIKVDDIHDALKRLLRFKLIDKNVTVYETNEIVLKLALQVITEPKFIVVNGEIEEFFQTLWDVEESAILLFCPTLTSRDIFTKTLALTNSSQERINIIEQTLFETSFIYDNTFYERQLISPFFMPYLELILNLFKVFKINYRLKKFTHIEHFEPVFTNKKFEIKEFGTSDKVLIFEKSTALIEEEISFLEKEAAWAKTLYVLPFSLHQELPQSDTIILYKSSNEIINLLKQNEFHFALIVGVDKTILNRPISNQIQTSLFDFE